MGRPIRANLATRGEIVRLTLPVNQAETPVRVRIAVGRLEISVPGWPGYSKFSVL